MAHVRLVTAAARQQLAAHARAQRLAGRVRTIVRVAARDAAAALPDRPHFAQAGPVSLRVAAALAPLPRLLSLAVRNGLTDLAAWGHLKSARLLTARVRGRLRVRRVRREDESADLSDLYAGLVIDPPGEDLIRWLVGPAPERLTRLADPGDAAAAVWRSIAAGRDRRQVERDLLDVLQGVESAARRVARTEGLRVATQGQLAVSEELADMIPAYQVFSVGDGNVRPAHRERHGRTYWRHPRPGQASMAQMPHPPIEPDGSLAHNCRCMLVPVFEGTPEDELAGSAALAWDGERGLFVPG